MLSHLSIQNFALIDTLSLSFEHGYSGITGETGSGKSILLNALGLLIGDRADYGVIGSKKDKSIVEGEFKVNSDFITSFLTDHDIDFADPMIIRREITKQGKSRAFINDTPVNLQVLRALGAHLIYIHSQYNTLELKDKSFQMDLLDELADLKPSVVSYQEKFRQLTHKKATLNRLEKEIAERKAKADYNRFVLNELESLDLVQRNYEQIEQDLNALEHATEIITAFSFTAHAIQQEGGLEDQIALLKQGLEKTKNLHPSIQEIQQRIQEVQLELKDIAEQAQDQQDSIDIHPEKIKQLSQELDMFNRICLKYQCKNQQELIDFEQDIASQVDQISEIETNFEILQKEVAALSLECQHAAESLHQNRINQSEKIAQSISSILHELKLPDTSIVFALEASPTLHEQGVSELKLLFSANKGVLPIEIEKAASGGELSRVMLALQYLISAKKNMPTLFFDEIDTGVSGEVALKIGRLLSKMGEHAQIIAISHLPQVVAKAKYHYQVVKHEVEGRTQTFVKELLGVEKVEEIARLMSGEIISAEAIQNAKILMDS